MWVWKWLLCLFTRKQDSAQKFLVADLGKQHPAVRYEEELRQQ